MPTEKQLLIDFIKRTHPIPDPIATDIVSHFEQVYFKKNESILEIGKVCNNYIFIEQGFIRAYTFDSEGNEVTTNFYGKSSVVFEVSSFFKRTPSQENIQALTDCMGWQVTFEQLNHLFHSIQEFREFGRAVLVNGFTGLKERMLSMINNTAEQRYEHLMRHNPDIFQNTSLKNIASYLGITDTSLSRIRKEITQNK